MPNLGRYASRKRMKQQELEHDRRRRLIKRIVLGSAALCLLTGAIQAFVDARPPSAEQIETGRLLFEHTWQQDDVLSAGGDGLGPVFNEKSCVACHFQGGVGGSGPSDKNVVAFEALPTPNRTEIRGGVVHAAATMPEFEESHQRITELFPIVVGGIKIDNGCTVRLEDFNPVQFGDCEHNGIVRRRVD